MIDITFADMQYIILIKLCFFVFVALGVFGIYKKWKPIFFVVLASVTSCLAYYFLVHGTRLPFWGLVGDEHFIVALYESMAHGRFWSDFAYASLPPFYPPLFFWLFALVGKFFDWNGVQIMKFANLCTFAFFPIVFYFLQKLIWNKSSDDKNLPGRLALAVSSIFLLVVVNSDVIILKQYEFVSSALTVVWSLALLHFIYNKKNNWKTILIFGLTGGLLFVTFYFWFFLVAIGVAVFNLFLQQKITPKHYLRFGLIGFFVLLFSSFFWLPLALSYYNFGAENWQLGYTNLDRVLTFLPSLYSAQGLLALFGFGSMIWFRKNFYIRSLLALFSASFIWQAVGLLTILFFSVPIQEDKGFMFWNATIIALAVAFALEKIWINISKKIDSKTQVSIGILAIIVLATQLIFGVFTNDKNVLAVRSRSMTPATEVREIVQFLEVEYPEINEYLILQSGIPVLHAFLPINSFIHFNQHASHPAANFSQRFYYLKELSQVQTKRQFYDKIVTTPFGQIDLLILFKDGDNYSLFFSVDDFPRGIKEVVIDIPQNLIGDDYFEEKFENKDFVVFETKL